MGCGERPAVRAKGLVPAVVAERPRSAPVGVGEAAVRAKGLVDFVCCGWRGGAGGMLVLPEGLETSVDCRKGLVPVWVGTWRAAGGGVVNDCCC